MKKSITIVGYRRPFFMKKMFETLVKNDLEGWDIYIGLDKDPQNVDRHRQFIQEYVPQANVFWRDWHYHLPRWACISRNLHDLISRAYANGSEYNLYIEDDLTVSPDVTQIADWYGQSKIENTFCLNLTNRSNNHSIASMDSPEKLIVSIKRLHQIKGYPSQIGARQVIPGFNPFAHVTKRREWYEFINQSTFFHKGWDHGWGIEARHRDLDILVPFVTRCDHHGTHGVHIKNNAHNKKKGWGFHKIYDGLVAKDDFILV